MGPGRARSGARFDPPHAPEHELAAEELPFQGLALACLRAWGAGEHGRRRAPGERPFAVIKRVFGSGHVLVTTVGRVAVKMLLVCFGYDLYQLRALRRAEVV
jgi:hypothetical protein